MQVSEDKPKRYPEVSDRLVSKPSRSRAACSQCRQVKQKCDGPSRIPCRRCELYNLECTYDGAGATSTSRASSSRVMRPSVSLAPSSDVNVKLEEISDRLRRIESAIQRSGSRYSPKDSASPPATEDLSSHERVRDGKDEVEYGDTVDNPIGAFQKTISAFEAMSVNSMGPLSTAPSPFKSDSVQMNDAISRGLLTVQEASERWNIFWTRCLPWAPVLSWNNNSNDMDSTRHKSSLLFDVMLTTGAYYMALEGPRALQIYNELIKLTYEDMGQLLISPHVIDVDVSVVNALLFVQLWKIPSPHNPSTFLHSNSQLAAKLNAEVSFMLGGIASRISHRLGLSNSITSLSSVSVTANPEEFHKVLSSVRTYFLLLTSDTQVTMQSDRPLNGLDTTEVMKNLRLFTSLRDQPSDVRVGALVEIWSAGRHAPFHWAEQDEAKEIKALDLCRSEFERWRQFWPRFLSDTDSYNTDPLASICENIASPWVRFRVYCCALRWWDNYCMMKRNGKDAELSPAFYTYMNLAIEAGEQLIFNLSMESRPPDNRLTGVRRVQWQPVEPHVYHPLMPDVELAKMMSGSPDTFLMTALAYPPLLLGKLASGGILTLDLTIRTEGSPMVYKNPSSSKLSRLLELSAAFLERSAPHPGHPCRKQSMILVHLRNVLTPPSTHSLPSESQVFPPTALAFETQYPLPNGLSAFSFDTINPVMEMDWSQLLSGTTRS